MASIEHIFKRASGEIMEQNGIVREQIGDFYQGRIQEERGRARKAIADIEIRVEETVADLRRMARGESD